MSGAAATTCCRNNRRARWRHDDFRTLKTETLARSPLHTHTIYASYARKTRMRRRPTSARGNNCTRAHARLSPRSAGNTRDRMGANRRRPHLFSRKSRNRRYSAAVFAFSARTEQTARGRVPTNATRRVPSAFITNRLLHNTTSTGWVRGTGRRAGIWWGGGKRGHAHVNREQRDRWRAQ